MRRTLACAASLALALAGATVAQAQERQGSLEAFLKRLRTEREAEHERLRPRVDELVKKLGRARTSSEVEKALAGLDALGSEAAPLALAYLDPGAEPKPEDEKQAHEVATWLARTRDPSLHDELVRMARSGSPLGRSLAVRVLGESPDVERARAALAELYEESEGPLRADLVAALARAAPDDARIGAALEDSHPAVVAAAVRALASEPRKKPRPEVLALLADESRGADVLPALVEYFSFPGQQLDEETFVKLVRFALREDLPVEMRLAVLAGCPHYGADLTSRVRREFEPLVTSSDTAIREAALVALALRKDSRAKRDLLREYDEKVEGSPGWPAAFQQRGDVHYRIGDYREAAQDYQEALRLHGDNARLVGNRDLWVNLARAYVKDNKLKPAAETLEEFGIPSEVRKLRDDPDFLPLVESAKYKSLFE